MSDFSEVRVSVVFAQSEDAWFVRDLSVPAGTTIEQALALSGFMSSFPQFSIEELSQAVGVFGVRLPLSSPLHEGDRVEICRPLVVDPKMRRMRLVNGSRQSGKWRRAVVR